MSHPNKVRGYRWEALIETVLHTVWPSLQRTGSARSEYGDFEDPTGTCPFVLEAKDEKTITLSKYLDQVSAAAARLVRDVGAAGWPVVLVKRRQRNALAAYAVMEVETFLDVAKRIQELEADNLELIAQLETQRS